MQGHASGLQLQLELVLKSEQWVPSAVEGSVQRFLDHLFQPPANGSTAQLGGAEDISGPSTNGARARSMHEGSSPHAPSIDSSPSRAADSTSLALALDSAVNTEEAAKRLQGLPGADNRQHGASGAEEHRGEAPVDTALYVGDQRFVVVGSAGLLLQHVQALLAFGHAHIALRYEMGTRVAALVRAFDTGSQELLLGAAAISSAGLRSITARHMGVCSQCLLLLEVVLPRLRSTALEGLPAAQVASLATIYESVAEVCSSLSLPGLNATCLAMSRGGGACWLEPLMASFRGKRNLNVQNVTCHVIPHYRGMYGILIVASRLCGLS